MLAKDFTITVVNISKNATDYKYIIARCVDNEMWYYGATNDRQQAVSIAHEFDNALVITNT